MPASGRQPSGIVGYVLTLHRSVIAKRVAEARAVKLHAPSPKSASEPARSIPIKPSSFLRGGSASPAQSRTAFHLPESDDMTMDTKQLTWLILAVPCPTCGAAPREKCELHSGQPRTAPHRDRHLNAAEKEKEKLYTLLASARQ